MLGKRDIRQVAYVVEDIEQSMKQWSKSNRTGPFTCYKNVDLTMLYQGAPSSVTLNVAIAFSGNLQVELIQPLTDTESPYQYPSGRKMLGMHHVAFATRNLDESLEQLLKENNEVVAVMEAVVGRYAYYRDPMMPDNLFELLEVDDELELFWEAARQTAEDWDGKSDPVTIFDLAPA